jgi:hypothetical protein
MLSALITIALALATALPASADIYRYRDSSGKLVITNQPPPAGAVVESQRPSQDKPTAEEVQDAYDELGITPEPKRREPRPAPEPTLSYVDLHPIEHSSYVERSNVYWKRFVTGRVKNRSGRTTATDVTVRAECTAGGGRLPTAARRISARSVRAARRRFRSRLFWMWRTTGKTGTATRWRWGRCGAAPR